MHRLAPALALFGSLVLTSCARSADGGSGEVVAAVAPTPAEGVGVDEEVLQGTVTGVAATGDRVTLLVRLAWAPVLQAENRTLEVHIDHITRFVPPAFRNPLQEGDEVQVSVPTGGSERIHASEVTVLDLD